MKKLLRITFILIYAIRRLRCRGFGGRQFPVVCLLLSAVVIAVSALNASPIPLSTTTEFTSTAIARFRAYHGETVRLTHRLTLAGAPLDLSGASARFYWRTEEMEDWWSTDATLEGDAVSCDFTPEMDPGTEAIWYFFGITQEKSIAYRANGSLTLLDSPGFIPADLGEPDALAAALEALFKEADSRYATKAELTSLEEGLTAEAAERESADQQLHQALAVESTQRTAQLTALINTLATKAEQSHTHTISQVTNLQAQLNNKASTSTVSALTTRVSTAEAAIEEVADAKADALTREATVNNVGSLDPMSNASMATADQMNGLSYQKTTLGAMGFEGAAVKIKRFATFRRGGSTDNGSTNMWLRILRHNGTTWIVAYQATTYVTHSSYTENGQRTEHTMVHKAGTQFIPTDEPVIFCYATSESAPASSFINFGMKVVPASPNMLSSGQSSLPAVNATPGWAHSLAFDAVYELQVALSEALEGKADAFTVGEGLTLEAGVLSADAPKITVDATLSFNSTNPVQNHVITRELHNVSGTSVKFNENPSAGFEEFKEGGGRAFKFLAENDNSMEMGIKEGKIAWTDGNGTKREMVLDEGGGAEGLETWADDGTAGIDPSKTFVGVDASHVFHANGQIHGAQMLSADTNKRLYVPFDLMQNDEERWLSAASVWNGNRNIIFNGDTTTLVQPLVPTNKGDNAAYVPYALPCFENSPIFWKGQMIWHDGTTTLSKSVCIPWSRVTGTTASPSELALKSDLETLKSEPTPPTLEVATWSGSVCSVPWGTNPLLIDCTDLEVADVVFSFPIDSWPEGAQRTLILRTGAMTDATGTGTLLHAFTQQDATLLTAKIHGYEVFPTGEEIICSAMRLGNTIHLTTTMRSSL